MLDIEITTHDEMRYDTAGDWYDTQGALNIEVVSMPDWRYEALVAVHELVEVLLCRQRGITTEQVDEFDSVFAGEGEPGDDPSAPYAKEHRTASIVEQLLAHELGVNWKEYDDYLAALQVKVRGS